MSPQAFERMLVDLLESMNMRIVEIHWVNEEEIDILAHNPAPILGGDYIIHGILVPEGDFVNSIRVIGLSDTVRAERALKGILISTGYFTEEVQKILRRRSHGAHQRRETPRDTPRPRHGLARCGVILLFQ